MKLTLNGSDVQAHEGETLLDVCRREGVDVPTLCHEDRAGGAYEKAVRRVTAQIGLNVVLLTICGGLGLFIQSL